MFHHKESIKNFYAHNLEKNGIIRDALSHTQRMDMQTDNEKVFTPEKTVTISRSEAEEYCAYKRHKKLAEITSAISHAELRFERDADAQTICALAEKYKLASVKMPLAALSLYGGYFVRRGVACDCVIGGTGETLTAVKGLEAKLALRFKAKEITLTLSSSDLQGARYAEIRKELKKLRRITKRAYLKVCLDGKHPYGLLSRLARICAEEHVDYLSIPFFAGCEKLRAELFGGCLLEVCGVDNLLDYKKMIGAGVGRILCNDVQALRTEWMKEVQNIQFPAPQTEKIQLPDEQTGMKKTETMEKGAQPPLAENKGAGLLPLPTQAWAKLKGEEKKAENG